MSSATPGGGPEPGLFVVWSDAADVTPAILDAIGRDFRIDRIVRVRWSERHVDHSFARFYRGQPVGPYSTVFADQKGRDPFMVVLVTDEEPRYELRDTTRGPAVVNANMLDAKQRFRAWTGGGMRVHGTDSRAEAARDSILLLGDLPADLTAQAAWDGTVDERELDLAGADGWPDLRTVLHVLNHSTRYVVLRNFEPLPDEFSIGEHGDVDLLGDDYLEMVRVLNARPMVGRLPRWGGRFLVTVGGEDVIFDLRFVGDRYYEERWERRLLDRRRLVYDAFYAPDETDYLETLAYHALIHKRAVADDYRDRLAAMAADLELTGWGRDGLDDDRIASLVRDAAAAHGYDIVRPRDPTVFFNYAAAGMARPWLRRKAAGVRRELHVRTAPLSLALTRAVGRARRDVVGRAPWLRDVRRRFGV